MTKIPFLCLVVVALLANMHLYGQTASFTAPDTVCVGQSFNVTNTSSGVSEFVWNFCSSDQLSTPTGVNLGNPAGQLGIPVFSDYVLENGNYYVLVVNNGPGGLVRLNFGNSLLNTPTSTYLGAILPNSMQGIQIVNEGGNITAIVVGGDPLYPVASRIMRLSFGSTITNTPVVTDWGNIGGLNYPVELYMFKQGAIWYGLTVNHRDNSITRFTFGSNFTAIPTGQNLGTIGGLNLPSGLTPVIHGGNWYMFVSNVGGNVSRIDFGNSLLNMPTGQNLGNVGSGGVKRDIQFADLCGEKVGFLIEGNSLVKLNFPTITSIPTSTPLGNIGNMNGPHSFSRIFRVGASSYSFVWNAASHTITRINFTGGCTNATPSFSTATSPGAISYSASGTYTINLLADEGLPTQSSFCKKVVVIDPPAHSPTMNVQSCGAGVRIGSSVKPASYLWNTGATTDSIFVTTPGTYWVESSRFGCTVRDSFIVNCIQPSFTAPDTVCVNQSFSVSNTSTGASSYLWNFCSSDQVGTPGGVNLGNPGTLGIPVFSDHILENGNYYMLVVNNGPGGLERLNFGNSLLNTPTSTYLGAILPNSMQGIQIVAQNGNVTAIVVGGDPLYPVASRIMKLDFGGSITNAPTVTDWGNIGSLNYPVELYMFKEGVNWYGITVNHRDNSLTRFSFGSNFTALPAGINLGNIGAMNLPSGLVPVNEAGNWFVFVANVNGSLTRLSFGNSLLNTPTGVNLGNLGVLSTPRDLHFVDLCGQKVGFLLDGGTNSIVRLNFASLTSVPTATSLGNIGNLNAPHSFSRMFRVEGSSYAYVWNAGSNTMTRINFTGSCAASTPSFSLAQNPGAISYSASGTYTINLLIDEGLPTQSSFCKKVVVMDPPAKSPVQTITACSTSIKIGSSIRPATYLWNTGATTDSITVTASGTYWVESSRFGCTVRDSFVVTLSGIAKPDFGFFQNPCSPKNVEFFTYASGVQSIAWSFGDGQTNTTDQHVFVTYSSFGSYQVKLKVTNAAGCSDSTVKQININAIQQNSLLLTEDTTICAGESVPVRLSATGATNCFQYQSGSSYLLRDTVVTPSSTSTYYYTALTKGANLLSNSDFSQGTTGFSSDYTFVTNNSGEGQYGVGANTISWDPSLNNCKDRTTGAGNMLMAHGSTIPGKSVWKQTVAVTPNTNYVFSFWFQSLIPGTGGLDFFVDDHLITDNLAFASNYCLWLHYYISWNSGSKTTADLSIVFDGPANQKFALDDMYFGTGVMQTDSLVVTVVPKPILNITNADSAICAGTSVQLNATTDFGTISWSPPAYLNDPSIANPVATPVATTKYYAQVGSMGGCVVRDSVTITVVKIPQVQTIADTAVCAGSSLVLQSTITDATSIQWQPAATLNNSSIASPVATPAVFTEYIVTATNNGMCAVKDSVKVNIKPLPLVTVTNDTTVCGNVPVQLAATGGGTYLWSPAAGLSSATIPNPVAQPATTTKYKVVVTGANGCQKTDSVTIQVVPAPVFAITPLTQSVCAGVPVTITASGGDRYNWLPVPGITDPTLPSVTLTPTASGTYSVNVTHTTCNVSQVLTASVQVNPLPVVTVTKAGDVTCSSLETQLIATGGISYLWSPAATLSNANIANPVAFPTENTTYTVKVGSAEGCYVEDTITVLFLGGSGNTLFIPNAFSPNNDGLNDQFRAFFPGVKKFQMLIFNGWGEKIYETTDISKGWDGFYKGRKQGTDVYVYLVNAEGVCGGKLFRKGTFMLIR